MECKVLEMMTWVDWGSWAVIFICGTWKLYELTGNGAETLAKRIIQKVEGK